METCRDVWVTSLCVSHPENTAQQEAGNDLRHFLCLLSLDPAERKEQLREQGDSWTSGHRFHMKVSRALLVIGFHFGMGATPLAWLFKLWLTPFRHLSSS